MYLTCWTHSNDFSINEFARSDITHCLKFGGGYESSFSFCWLRWHQSGPCFPIVRVFPLLRPKTIGKRTVSLRHAV